MNIHDISRLGLLQYASQQDERYVPLEWLASTGNAIIDTGARGNNSNLKIEARFKYEGWSSYRYFFCAYTGENTNATRLLLQNSDNNSGYATLNTKAGGGSTAIPSVLTKDTWHTLAMDKTECIIDTTTRTMSTTSGAPLGAVNIFLFNRTGYSAATTCTVYFSSFKIYDNGVLIRDFVPMLRVRDGKPGMYDRVHNRFYINSGSGNDFTWKEAIPPDNEIWYWASAMVTPYNSTGIVSHTFSGGRGVLRYSSAVETLSNVLYGKDITGIALPNSVTTITDQALRSTRLVTMVIPENVAMITNYCFMTCTSLTKVYFRGTPTSVYKGAFYSDTNITDIYVPWSEDTVDNAPWGAENATIHYNYTA